MQVGHDGSPLEPCPVRSQPPAEMSSLKMPGQPEVKEVQELYCNEAMYGFWRLYHYCYERLQVARNCILEKHGKATRSNMVQHLLHALHCCDVSMQCVPTLHP